VLGQPYEDVYVEAARIDPKHRGKGGLYNRELVAVARRLGILLQPTRRRFDASCVRGVLRVRPMSRRSPFFPEGHFVALSDGQVYCPLYDVRMPLEEYLSAYHARACTLLEVIA
jgi:hypothetical protein